MFKIDGNPRRNYRVRLKDKTIALPMYVESELPDDEELWRAYQANIAVQFQDATYNYRKKHPKSKHYLNREDIWKISNEAAENFLKLWVS